MGPVMKKYIREQNYKCVKNDYENNTDKLLIMSGYK